MKAEFIAGAGACALSALTLGGIGFWMVATRHDGELGVTLSFCAASLGLCGLYILSRCGRE